MSEAAEPRSQKTRLEVLFAPAEFESLTGRDLSGTVCVVFDILRATSSMMTALANGASQIVPVAEIAEALDMRRQRPDVVLAGERNGLRIRADQTGGIDFDLGNSPREFTAERVAGKTIVMTTTNGTRALRACLAAERTYIGTFLGMRAIAAEIERTRPRDLLLVCSGTHDQASYEDALAAGALCEMIWEFYEKGAVADSAAIVRNLYVNSGTNLLEAMRHARNGRRLLSLPDLAGDVSHCLQRDVVGFLADLSKNGVVKRCS